MRRLDCAFVQIWECKMLYFRFKCIRKCVLLYNAVPDHFDHSKTYVKRPLSKRPNIGFQYQLQYRFPSLIQPLNSSLTHYSLALRYRGGTGTITQWIDNWNYWNDIGHTIPLHAGNRRAPEKSLNSGDFFLIMNSVSTTIEINI